MENLSEKYPLIKKMQEGQEVFWQNPNLSSELSDEVSREDVQNASKRLLRFAPYIKRVYPETGDGIIESPLTEINRMKEFLSNAAGKELKGRLFLKRDSDLPISGSIKARGGIYEVLCLAEKIALENGLKLTDDYSVLSEEKYKSVFSQYSIAVGSTGNLGLSIGIMGAKLGFNVTVHMSVDAKQWKKDLLREKGASVIEHEGDYGEAVAVGRRQAEGDPKCHFVDDEKSMTLFLGYSVPGERLKKQLDERGIAVDNEHPLYVYLPCGVGNGPGGVAYGLKQVYGENVHCFFAEPVNVPSMLLGMMTGKLDEICVQDIGLSGKTIADGLACSRCAAHVGRLCGKLLDGIFTVADRKMQQLVVDLYNTEGIFIEPSAAAGFPGYELTNTAGYNSDGATHVVWATGGSMAPESERNNYLTF